MHSKELYDVTIIGGGPAGLYSAFYSGLREMKTKVIESQPELGGKVRLYPEKIIWDVGGLPPTTGQQFLNQLINQGLTFKPTIYFNTKVSSIFKNEDEVFEIHTVGGSVHFSKTVIMAIGGGIITPQKLDIDGADRFEVTNLHYTIQSLEQFRGKHVLISGGGNSAVDWANELEPVAEKVYVTYRKDGLKGHESEVTRLLNSSVECFFHTTIRQLLSTDGDRINHVTLLRENTGESMNVEVDEVVVNHGYERDVDLLEGQGQNLAVALTEDKFIAGDADGSSSVPGLFAAGDILKHGGKLNLLAGCFQDAANAVNQAKLYIAPDARRVGLVSSHNDKFKSWNKQLKEEMSGTRSPN